MHNKLEEILKKTREDLEKRKKDVPFSVILNPSTTFRVNSVKDLYSSASPTRPFSEGQNDSLFYQAILKPKYGSIAIIAEVKFASPTEKNLGSHEELLSRVKEYEKAGADAISTVTERHFFHGDPQFVRKIKQATDLPVLQKDFIMDEYQIYEIAKAGADAILLIAKLLTESELVEFVRLSQSLGLEPVVEINDELDLKKALKTNTKIIAVNARDLTSFIVDVDRACKLIQKIPGRFIKLGFSGVTTRLEVEKYKKAGAHGVLIGTSLMKAQKIADFLEGVRV